jgi:hypothetical protein
MRRKKRPCNEALLSGQLTFLRTSLTVNRMGNGTNVVRASGVHPKTPTLPLRNHIDTSDFYGPHTTNQNIRKRGKDK